ncbi:MAG: YpmA family protein [Desulfitobacteriaceae bacterium]|nr:YpmA family protein [Desulfitobacteriaceae bacterium]MDD4346990.1 YpmA family protein [Desulfitobacteriaceae bacterium]MDD4401719.1 YpmA family protein [Desulfitobacteriaceae bacterium]
MADNNTGRMELIATCKVQTNAELYKVIDFLNKNLKNHQVMFGLTKKEEIMIISIYEID